MTSNIQKKCEELEEDGTCSILEHMGNNGKQSYNVRYFNLDMIMSVGYQGKLQRGISGRCIRQLTYFP